MSNQRQINNNSFREENKIYAMLRIHSKWMLPNLSLNFLDLLNKCVEPKKQKKKQKRQAYKKNGGGRCQ